MHDALKRSHAFGMRFGAATDALLVSMRETLAMPPLTRQVRYVTESPIAELGRLHEARLALPRHRSHKVSSSSGTAFGWSPTPGLALPTNISVIIDDVRESLPASPETDDAGIGVRGAIEIAAQPGDADERFADRRRRLGYVTALVEFSVKQLPFDRLEDLLARRLRVVFVQACEPEQTPGDQALEHRVALESIGVC